MKTLCRLSCLVAGLTLLSLVSPATSVWAAPAAVTPEARNDGPWVPFWPDRHEAMNKRVKEGNVDLIFVGDSITQLWEREGAEVWKKYYANRNAVNLGIGGDQTQHVLWRLDHGNLDGISPKLAVVMIGTNNSSAGHTPEEICEGVKTILERIGTKCPKTKILLMAILPRGLDNQNPQRQNNAKANPLLAKLADNETVFFLDLSEKFVHPDGTVKKELLPDEPHYLHLSEEGYTIWAESIEPFVKKYLEEK